MNLTRKEQGVNPQICPVCVFSTFPSVRGEGLHRASRLLPPPPPYGKHLIFQLHVSCPGHRIQETVSTTFYQTPTVYQKHTNGVWLLPFGISWSRTFA